MARLRSPQTTPPTHCQAAQSARLRHTDTPCCGRSSGSLASRCIGIIWGYFAGVAVLVLNTVITDAASAIRRRRARIRSDREWAALIADPAARARLDALGRRLAEVAAATGYRLDEPEADRE